jgi:hypothetical protein
MCENGGITGCPAVLKGVQPTVYGGQSGVEDSGEQFGSHLRRSGSCSRVWPSANQSQKISR